MTVKKEGTEEQQQDEKLGWESGLGLSLAVWPL